MKPVKLPRVWIIHLGRLLLLSVGVLASGGLFLGTLFTPATVIAACAALPSTAGTAQVTLQLPTAGTYRVWVREQPATSSATSFYLQIADAGACSVSMGGAPLPAGVWSWVDYTGGQTANTENVTVTSGNHLVEFAGQSPSVLLDKVLLLSSTSCVPTGDGTNCTSAGVSSQEPSPGPSAAPVAVSSGQTQTVSGTINVTPTNLPAGVKDIHYFVDNEPVASPNIDTFGLSNGNHTIKITAKTKNGQSITQQRTINVDNPITFEQKLVYYYAANKGLAITLALLIILIPITWFVTYRYGLFRYIRTFMDNVRIYIDQTKSDIAQVPGLASPSLNEIPPEDLADRDPSGGMQSATNNPAISGEPILPLSNIPADWGVYNSRGQGESNDASSHPTETKL